MIEILRRDEYDPLHLDLVHLTGYMATMGLGDYIHMLLKVSSR